MSVKNVALKWVLFAFSWAIASSCATEPKAASSTVLPPAFDADSRRAPDQPAAHSPNTAESPLPEVGLGNPKAPLKIVMYHSLACGHCKNFKEEMLPIIKEQFIDKGYVYFVFVDFPTDRSALEAAKIAWSRKNADDYAAISRSIVDHEDQWVGKLDWQERLCTVVASQGSMTKAQCEEAMTMEALGNQILKTAFIAQKEYGIDYAPAFILNGKLHKGTGLLSPAEISAELAKLGINP